MSASEWRENLLNYLGMVADPARQLAWERDERIGHGPWGLREERFDLYHPDPDICREAFSTEELERLREFHLVIEQAVPLPDASVAAMLESQAWQRVVAAANDALQRTGRAE